MPLLDREGIVLYCRAVNGTLCACGCWCADSLCECTTGHHVGWKGTCVGVQSRRMYGSNHADSVCADLARRLRLRVSACRGGG